MAELYAVPRIERPLWVAEQLEVALFEGLAHRISAALRRLTDRRRAQAQTDERGVRVKGYRKREKQIPRLTMAVGNCVAIASAAFTVYDNVVDDNPNYYIFAVMFAAFLMAFVILRNKTRVRVRGHVRRRPLSTFDRRRFPG